MAPKRRASGGAAAKAAARAKTAAKAQAKAKRALCNVVDAAEVKKKGPRRDLRRRTNDSPII